MLIPKANNYTISDLYAFMDKDRCNTSGDHLCRRKCD